MSKLKWIPINLPTSTSSTPFSSRRLWYISGTSTYSLPSKHTTVSSRRISLSQVLPHTSYGSKHTTSVGLRISSILGAPTYIICQQAHYGQQPSHLLYLRCSHLQSIPASAHGQQPSHLVYLRCFYLHATPVSIPLLVAVVFRLSQVLLLTHYASKHTAVSNRRSSSLLGASTYTLCQQAHHCQQPSHFVYLRCFDLHPTPASTPW